MNNVIGYASSCNSYAYYHDGGVCQDQSKWMASLKDNTKLSALSIPGTHDSMSNGPGGDIAQNQSKTLADQLTSGIRFIDIRLAAYPNTPDFLYANHGFIYLNATFSSILDVITNFLKNNPSETILMRTKQEYTNQSDATFTSLLNKFFTNSKYSSYIYNYTGNNNPTLKDLRGKILVLQNFGGAVNWLLYNNFTIQDNYNLNTNWDLYNKWLSVKDAISKANQSYLNGGGTGYINYLNGSGGVFPYFVASGHSDPRTNAPRLWTGLTEPMFHNSYPDFPRANWFGVFASIMFEGTNELTKAYIDDNKPSYVGIIVADFIGQGLINSIINLNLR